MFGVINYIVCMYTEHFPMLLAVCLFFFISLILCKCVNCGKVFMILMMLCQKSESTPTIICILIEILYILTFYYTICITHFTRQMIQFYVSHCCKQNLRITHFETKD